MREAQQLAEEQEERMRELERQVWLFHNGLMGISPSVSG